MGEIVSTFVNAPLPQILPGLVIDNCRLGKGIVKARNDVTGTLISTIFPDSIEELSAVSLIDASVKINQ